jgi:hypothetical protein
MRSSQSGVQAVGRDPPSSARAEAAVTTSSSWNPWNASRMDRIMHGPRGRLTQRAPCGTEWAASRVEIVWVSIPIFNYF